MVSTVNAVSSLQVPEGYDATYKHFAAQGARVIALARRLLPVELSGPELRGLSREEVEQEMDFEGFAVFQVSAGPAGPIGGVDC
jgi:cation-transporting ATPase 13A1